MSREHMFVHSEQTVTRALELIDRGMTSSAIARELDVPRGTIRTWRAGRTPSRRRQRAASEVDLERLPPRAYAYLLGLYLGDGWIVRSARGTYCLRIALDQRYPEIIERAARSIADVCPTQRAGIYPSIGCSVVAGYWRLWPAVFPQHGPGPKHTRPIVLTDWQRRITHAEPRQLIRGLIHSDGCRFIANQRKDGRNYQYARYSFSNKSEDIKGIFCEHLDLLGIGWTRPNAANIAIDRRAEVAKLDAFVGPKC
jgi:hypothetical protein